MQNRLFVIKKAQECTNNRLKCQINNFGRQSYKTIALRCSALFYNLRKYLFLFGLVKKAFYNAVIDSEPIINIINSVMLQSCGRNVTTHSCKRYVVRVEKSHKNDLILKIDTPNCPFDLCGRVQNIIGKPQLGILWSRDSLGFKRLEIILELSGLHSELQACVSNKQS